MSSPLYSVVFTIKRVRYQCDHVVLEPEVSALVAVRVHRNVLLRPEVLMVQDVAWTVRSQMDVFIEDAT